jgi:hypothetical protein
MQRNIAGQHVGAQVNSQTSGAPVTSGVTLNVIGDGVLAVGTGTLVHVGGGWWDYVPAQAETDFVHVAFQFQGAGAISQAVQTYPTTSVGAGVSNMTAEVKITEPTADQITAMNNLLATA